MALILAACRPPPGSGTTLDEPLAALVKARKNILISGGISTGKTTMLRVLVSAIPRTSG